MRSTFVIMREDALASSLIARSGRLAARTDATMSGPGSLGPCSMFERMVKVSSVAVRCAVPLWCLP